MTTTRVYALLYPTQKRRLQTLARKHRVTLVDLVGECLAVGLWTCHGIAIGERPRLKRGRPHKPKGKS